MTGAGTLALQVSKDTAPSPPLLLLVEPPPLLLELLLLLLPLPLELPLLLPPSLVTSVVVQAGFAMSASPPAVARAAHDTYPNRKIVFMIACSIRSGPGGRGPIEKSLSRVRWLVSVEPEPVHPQGQVGFFRYPDHDLEKRGRIEYPCCAPRTRFRRTRRH
jgi:hypothetical protein